MRCPSHGLPRGMFAAIIDGMLSERDTHLGRLVPTYTEVCLEIGELNHTRAEMFRGFKWTGLEQQQISGEKSEGCGIMAFRLRERMGYDIRTVA